MNVIHRYLSLVFIMLLMLTACDDKVAASDDMDSERVVKGSLKLVLHKRQPVGLYVHYRISQHNSEGELEKILLSETVRIEKHPVEFSLSIPAAAIIDSSHYRLTASISEDEAAEQVIAGITREVLTQGQPSELFMVIQPLRQPIE